MTVLASNCSHFSLVSWLQGLLLVWHIAFPSPPFYLVAFSVFFISLFFCFISSEPKLKLGWLVLLLVMAYILISLISSFISLGVVQQRLNVVLGSVVLSLFYIFGSLVPNKRQFWLAYSFSSLVLALYIIAVFVVSGASQYGVRLFVNPEFRLWGAGYIPDWPNYVFIPIIISVFMRRCLGERIGITDFILMFACFITTSRVALFGIVFFMFIYLLLDCRKLFFTIIFSAAFLLSNFDFQVPEFFLERIAKTSDREYLFSGLINAWYEAPFFGWGSVRVSDVFYSTYHDSFHNTYLEVLVKSGIIGFLIFLFLLFSLICRLYFDIGKCMDKNKLYLFSLVFFLLISCLVQNYLKHPHIIMVFSVICFSGPLFTRSRMANA